MLLMTYIKYPACQQSIVLALLLQEFLAMLYPQLPKQTKIYLKKRNIIAMSQVFTDLAAQRKNLLPQISTFLLLRCNIRIPFLLNVKVLQYLVVTFLTGKYLAQTIPYLLRDPASMLLSVTTSQILEEILPMTLTRSTLRQMTLFNITVTWKVREV